MQLTLHHTVATAVRPSPHVRAVASMFGLGLDQSRSQVLIPETRLTLHAHQLLLITGASGSGKSTLLRLIARETERLKAEAGRMKAQVPSHDEAGRTPSAFGIPPSAVSTLWLDALPAPEDPAAPLVDQFGDRPLNHVLRLLSRAGLSDAFVMLRSPDQLSDGQRYRFNLARGFAAVEDLSTHESPQNAHDASPAVVMLADEFGAALDRTTARAIAAHLRKWVDREPVCVAVATTHDDLLEPLAPDVLIDKPLGPGLHVYQRPERE